MKNYFILLFIFVSFNTSLFGQGSGCSTATNLGTPTSTPTCINPTDFSQNVAGMCTGTGGMGYSNYWYRFCTNAANNCVAFEITTNSGGEWMAAIYGGCSGSAGTPLVSGSVICNTIGGGSTGGTGYWSTAGNDPGVNITTANTCYYLRINATDAYASDLSICYYTEIPSEDNCTGAIAIDGTPEPFDNACATEGATDPAPAQLCAGSLENTTWYSFTVANPCGAPCNVVITASGIDCAGGGEGFQIGYFSGTCGSLTNIGCTAGSGGTVTATLTGATPGATYYVAMDGNAGANCFFDLSATNTIPQPVELLYFRGLLFEDRMAAVQWSTATEFNASHYVISRSDDGINYRAIGSEPATNTQNIAEYTFNDSQQLINTTTYYKITQYDYDGNFVEFQPVAIASTPSIEELTVVPNPVNDNAMLYFNAYDEGNAKIQILDLLGRIVVEGNVDIVKGGNSIKFNTSTYQSGIYFGKVTVEGETLSVKFVK